MALVKYTPEQALAYHQNNWGGNGKIEIMCKVPTRDVLDLTLAYSPGVAVACRAIHKDPELVHAYTCKDNLVAVVSDGTAVLGLGDIGPEAGLPVMEGKGLLFKILGGVDAFPMCLNTKKVDEIVQIVASMEPTLGGVNLEDISAPRCFDIEQQLIKRMNIPVFHDDQHGTAIVVLAALMNALKVVNKTMAGIKVVVNGAGASGMAVTKLLMSAGMQNVILCDTTGAIYEGRPQGMNPYKDDIARRTNRDKVQGKLRDAIRGADVFLGLSAANMVDADMVKSMAHDSIIFGMANPDPEILPEIAKSAGARIVATGRSDYPNQINNVLGFPGIFRGALDVRARVINEPMKLAAAHAIAKLAEDDLRDDRIIVNPLHEEVIAVEAREVARVAMETGVARVKRDLDEIYRNTKILVQFARERYQMNDDFYRQCAGMAR